MLCLSNLFLLLLVFNDVKESYAPHLLFLMILTGIYCQRSIKNCGSQIENHLYEMQISASGHGAANQSIELGPGTVARVKGGGGGGGVIIPSHKYMRRCLQLGQTTQHHLR